MYSYSHITFNSVYCKYSTSISGGLRARLGSALRWRWRRRAQSESEGGAAAA